MDKVLVEVFVPAVGKSYDMYISYNMEISQIVRLLLKMISELVDGRLDKKSEMVLCMLPMGKALPLNLTLAAANIKNGAKMMLF